MRRAAFTFRGDWEGPVIATAIHAGHDLRAEIAQRMTLDEDDRLREEDPYTDMLGARIRDGVVVHRSRFEDDLNRTPDDAVYRSPEHSWGLRVWRDEVLDEVNTEQSLQQHQDFYDALAERLDRLSSRGPFVVLDLHSYNHRRGGPEVAPEPQEDNPDINVGTGSLDRERWAPVVDAFMHSLAAEVIDGKPLDVRENVKFSGAELCRWVHGRYPSTGCALAIEFKKTFMDEWTGEPDHHAIIHLADALGRAADAAAAALPALG